MSKFILFSLFSLLIVVYVVEARLCYECKGVEECKNPKKVKCQYDEDGCTMIKANVTPFISKACTPYDDELKAPMYLEGCMRTTDHQLNLINATTCGCMGKDLCNSSSNFNLSILSILSLIFVVLFV